MSILQGRYSCNFATQIIRPANLIRILHPVSLSHISSFVAWTPRRNEFWIIMHSDSTKTSNKDSICTNCIWVNLVWFSHRFLCFLQFYCKHIADVVLVAFYYFPFIFYKTYDWMRVFSIIFYRKIFFFINICVVSF